MIRKLLPNIILIFVSIFVTYVFLESAYRIYRRIKLPTEYYEYYFQAIDTPIYLFDENIGFRYKPNSEGLYADFNTDNTILLSNKYRINNLGHISPHDDVLSKPNSEFRIALLGDSFTASLFNDVPWPSILEDILNTDDDLKKSLQVSTFKVINFGMDGTGIVQWGKVATQEVSRFDPDLVIVNFITDDIRRKFVWRISIQPSSSNGNYQLGLMCGSLPANLGNRDCAVLKMIVLDRGIFNDKDEISRIKREIYDEEVNRIDWFSPYPELFARTIGRFWGFRTKLMLSGQEIPYYDTEEEALKASVDALRIIKATFPNVMILHNPDPPETLSRVTPPLVFKLMGEQSDLDVVLMEKFLPAQADENEIRQWFKLPWDPHFSNYGAKIYAQAVYGRIRERLLSGR